MVYGKLEIEGRSIMYLKSFFLRLVLVVYLNLNKGFLILFIRVFRCNLKSYILDIDFFS